MTHPAFNRLLYKSALWDPLFIYWPMRCRRVELVPSPPAFPRYITLGFPPSGGTTLTSYIPSFSGNKLSLSRSPSPVRVVNRLYGSGPLGHMMVCHPSKPPTGNLLTSSLRFLCSIGVDPVNDVERVMDSVIILYL